MVVVRDHGSVAKRLEPKGPDASSATSSIRAQLDRLLASRTFANAPGLTRFLEHIVTQAMGGHGDRLKEYGIGVDVFQRGTSFDPNTDTIVRVSARRLRAKLSEYYATEGQADAIVVDLPKGRYVPEFFSRPAPAAQARAGCPHDVGVAQEWARGSSDASGSRPVFHVPAARNALIGREHDLQAVRQLLMRDDVRLVTLTGGGGSGKTRLAVEAASTVGDEFPGGVSFVSLAGISEPGAVTPTLAEVFRLRQTDGRSLVEALLDRVRTSISEPTLLVLDNFEHLLMAAPVVVALLDASAWLKILVTSRAVLRVYGEHDYSVPPLALPDRAHIPQLATLRDNPAVALFVVRATAADREFALTQENAAAVAEVCCRLDGLPLAIELAAARVRTLPPRAMVDRLQSRLDLPGSDHRDVPERHHTLRHTLDWSYGLLTAGEQQLFRRLSVFAGGCSLEGVEAVCNARLDLQLEPLEGVSALLDNSLSQRVSDGSTSRFRMIETVREYGLELLAVSGEREAVSRAHAAYCLVLAEEGNATATTPEERNDWLARCRAEHENLRAALDYLIAGSHAEWAQRLGIALHAFWDRLDHVAEGRARLEAILAVGGPEARWRPTWAKVAAYAASLAALQGDYDAMLALHHAGLEVYRELGDQRGIIMQLCGIGLGERERGDLAAACRAFGQCVAECRKLGDKWSTAAALSNLAGAVSALGDHRRAGTILEEATGVFREIGDWSGVAWACNHRGDIARDRGDPVEAARAYQEGLAVFRQTADRWGVARSCADLGFLACERHDHAAARAWFTEALRSFRAVEHRRGIIHAIEGLAVAAALAGETERALVLGGAAEALRKTVQAARRQSDATLVEHTLDQARQQAAPSARRLWSGSALLQLDDAIRIALEEPPSQSTPTTGS
jgi:predicted ATPase